MTYDVSLPPTNGEPRKTRSLGMMDILTENADSLMTVTQTLFDDLAVLVSSDDDDKLQKFNKMIVNLKNSMTDRCAVNKAFLSDFEKYLSEILPFVIDNYDQLQEDEVKNLIRVNDFYCGYHVTLGWSDVSDKALTIYENMSSDNFEDLTSKSSNSTVYSAIRAISHLLQVRGHAAASRAKEFNCFLHAKNETNKLLTFKGNRFGLLFQNAAMIVCHQKHILEFLDGIQQNNKLIEAVWSYMNNPVCISGIRALANIYVCIMIQMKYRKLLN